MRFLAPGPPGQEEGGLLRGCATQVVQAFHARARPASWKVSGGCNLVPAAIMMGSLEGPIQWKLLAPLSLLFLSLWKPLFQIKWGCSCFLFCFQNESAFKIQA